MAVYDRRTFADAAIIDAGRSRGGFSVVTPSPFRFAARVSAAYEFAPIFLIRMAGVPFGAMARLATPRTIALARELAARREETARAVAQAEAYFRSPERLLSEHVFRAFLTAVRHRRVPAAPVNGAQPAVFSNYVDAATNESAAEAELHAALEHELTGARAALLDAARELLPRYLIYGGAGVQELLGHLLATSCEESGTLPRRNARAGDRERHLLLYLQRICTKNDTFSEFGPSGWGRTDGSVDGVELAPEVGITKRQAFLERWTAHALAAAVNADPDIPRALAMPAMEPYAFEVLHRDVEQWPDSPAREKWLPVFATLSGLARRFAASAQPDDRRRTLDETRSHLRSLGVERAAGQRFLYAATNPIAEECFRETNFRISEALINEVATDAEPWIDLWRDSYAFVASRVAAGLRQILEIANPDTRVMPLPVFLKACESAKLPLGGPGLVALATMAFAEVKAAFRARLRPHAALAEYELTREDCHVVRDNFDYAKFDEYTYPSADLQLAAASADAVARGEYRWVIAELHPPPALLHHCMYWSCPDKPTLNAALAKAACGAPNFHFGFFAADFTSHTTVRIFDALPELTTFVAPQRANPAWRTVAPGDAEVFIEPETGDVQVRKSSSRECLGSFARAWVIPLGFHPFQFAHGPHTPRLRCGNVVVQRRTWTVRLEDFPAGDYSGISSRLVSAVEKWRAEKDLPRHIYMRPTEQALRRSGAEGRDKDTKPVYIDLESYLFLEIFYRWLNKAGELELTEMLPAPDQLLWQEEDGRRTFELRTLIVPRS